jgi:hypothetical protein
MGDTWAQHNALVAIIRWRLQLSNIVHLIQTSQWCHKRYYKTFTYGDATNKIMPIGNNK